MTKTPSAEQIVSNMRNFLYKDVLIMKPNKNEGKKGKTVRAELIGNNPTMFVKLENGNEIPVESSAELFFITAML